MTLRDPPGLVIEIEAGKAAFAHGYRLPQPAQGPWLPYRSHTVPGTIWLAAADGRGPWTLALDHPGVVAELALPPGPPGPGLARVTLPVMTPVYPLLARIYQLSASLPDHPLTTFQIATAALPRGTEAERMVVQRIGQNIFRARLMDYWQGCCPLTGITDTALLRASHITPWAECETDAERLNIHNGLLLSALWDAAFDRALVSFADDGTPIFGPTLTPQARTALVWSAQLPLTDAHRARLSGHRTRMTGQR